MPKPKEGESEKDFVARCIPIVMDDGTAKDDKQAVAMCYSMYRQHQGRKSVSLSVILKTDATSGRVRWKAIANSGEFDQQGDRFDESFFDDIVKNFWAVQDSVSRGEAAPTGYAHETMPIPQLDVAHYSFHLQRSDRIKARVGVPTFAYRDGRKLVLQGHFETTPLGQAASKSVLEDEKDVIKTSIGVWPDWGNVESLPDDKRVFKGGHQVAYLDHLALTAHPVDARTEISAEGEMSKSLEVKDDALSVLGDEALVKELEAARAASKSEAPDGVLLKSEEEGEFIPIGKPYPNEHAARVANPDDFSSDTFRRKEIAPGISIIMGKKEKGGSMETQAYRFDKDKFTPEEAKKWLKDHDVKYQSFEAAKEEKKSDATPVSDSIVTVTHETTTKDVTTVEKDNKADAIDAQNAQLTAQVVAQQAQTHPAEMPMGDSLAIARAIDETRSVLADAIKTLGTRIEALEKSQPNLSAIQDLATALTKSIEATQATEAQKVKAMLDNRGWLDIAKLYSARSASDNTVEGGARAKGPQEANPQEVAGGPIAGRFLRT